MPACFQSSTPVARKKHVCCECGGVIEIGEKYHLFSGVWQDGPARYKRCCDCQQLCLELDEGNDPNEHVWFTGLVECADESQDIVVWIVLADIIYKRKGSEKILAWMREKIEEKD